MLAAVHPRGILPGHVLVFPHQHVSKLSDLTELETLELFVCAQQIMRVFEEKLKFKSFEMIVNDGGSYLAIHIVPIMIEGGQRLHHTGQGR